MKGVNSSLTLSYSISFGSFLKSFFLCVTSSVAVYFAVGLDALCLFENVLMRKIIRFGKPDGSDVKGILFSSG